MIQEQFGLDPEFERFIDKYLRDARLVDAREKRAFIEDREPAETMIGRKHWHSYRVKAYVEEIARSEGISGEDFEVAGLCGLLHDVGRFPQANFKRSFNDVATAFDHGNEGAGMLESGLVDKFITLDMPTDTKEIVVAAARNHNKRKIESGLSERVLKFVKLTRDADKLDILVKQGMQITDTDLPMREDYLEALEKGKPVLMGADESAAERTLRYLGYIFDLEFSRSYQIVFERKIVDKKVGLLIEKTTDKELVERLKKIRSRLTRRISAKMRA